MDPLEETATITTVLAQLTSTMTAELSKITIPLAIIWIIAIVLSSSALPTLFLEIVLC